jgi:hypothetical protein
MKSWLLREPIQPLLRQVIFMDSYFVWFCTVIECMCVDKSFNKRKCVWTPPQLGFLFEYYMFFTSGCASNRKWLADVGRLTGNDSLTDVQQTSIRSDNQVMFHGWLMLQITSIGSNGRRQMFCINFIARCSGLSREGIDLLASYGYGVTLDMFDGLRKMYKVRTSAASR